MSETSPSGGSVLKGVAIGLACGVFLMVVIALSFTFWLVCIGVLQLVYIVPIISSYRKRGETETMKGLIIAAAIVLLLNAACDGFINPWSVRE